MYGKRSTVGKVLDEVVRLRQGGSLQRCIPMSWQDVGRKVGLSRPTILKYKRLAVEFGRIQLDEQGKEIISKESQMLKEYVYLEKDEFYQESLVSEWVTDLRTRGYGEPLSTWKSMVNRLRTICTICGINPEQLIVDKKTTETIMKNFAEIYKLKPKRKCKGKENSKSGIYSTVMPVRSFCAFHGLTWPRGVSGIMSGKVVSHGQYSDIRLTSDELEKANKFIKSKWGLDSDTYRIFWIGIESCARKRALFGMKCDWAEHVNKDTGKTIFLMTAYESKTKHIKNGKWRKYITREETQKSLKIHKLNSGNFIWKELGRTADSQDKCKNQIREIFRFLGKRDDYYYEQTFHSLRHIGAQYWLSKTSYNYGLVAKIGGWHTIDELKTIYGEMPLEFVVDMIETKMD